MTRFKEREFFKIVRCNGTDMATGKIDYVDAIGWTIYLTDEPSVNMREHGPRVCTSDVMHASVLLWDAYKYCNKPDARVLKVYGLPVCRSRSGDKHGFRELDVLRELDRDELVSEFAASDVSIFRYGQWRGQEALGFQSAERIVNRAFAPMGVRPAVKARRVRKGFQ